MFHWICPECGREIAPTVRECPVCDGGAEQAELVLAGVVEASARTSLPDSPARADHADRADIPPARAGGDLPARHASPNPALPEPVKWNRAADRATVEDRVPERVSAPVQEPAASEAASSDGANARPSHASEPVAMTPEILDAKSAFDRQAEAKVAGIRGILNRAADEWSHQAEGIEAKSVVTRTVESRAVDTRSIDHRGPDARGVQARTREVKAPEARPVNARQIETKTIETKPVETRQADIKPVVAKTMGSRAVEGPVASAPEHQKPADVPPSAASSGGVAFDRIPLLAKLSRLGLPKIAPISAAEAVEKDFVKIESVAAPAEAILPATPAVEPEITPATGMCTEGAPLAMAKKGLDAPCDAPAGVTPEATPYEPVLPVFATPDRESLSNLLDAVSLLDDEVLEQAAPPAAGKLPLPIRPAPVLPVEPALVSIGAVEPRLLRAPANQAVAMVNDLASPSTSAERKIAGLALVESRFPLQPPRAQVLKSVAAVALAALPPRAGAVRAPRSAAPFPSPNDAGLVKYNPLEKRPIQPAAPPVDLRKSSTAPRFTLPGPMLTRSLVAFTGGELTPIFLEARAFRKRFSYAWIAIVLAVGTVLGVGFSSMVAPAGQPPVEARAASVGSTGADAARPDGNPAESNAAQASPGPPAQATGASPAANPLSKAIEVTGFRIVLDPARKPQVQYLVVNHSPARFPDATIYVTLRAANAHVGQAPLCRFSFAAPDLGPFEAKEMTSAIEKTNRAVNLPEWQDLRAEVEIGR